MHLQISNVSTLRLEQECINHKMSVMSFRSTTSHSDTVKETMI